LDEGLFPSNRKLADAVGVDITLVGKALQIARLPNEVAQAFPSPTLIQFRWGAVLEAALSKNQDAVLARARDLIGSGTSAPEVFKALTTAATDKATHSGLNGTRTLDFGEGRTATLRLDKKGRLFVESSPGLLAPERLKELEKALRAFFK
jgi:ParB family chromosome partitioning protein